MQRREDQGTEAVDGPALSAVVILTGIEADNDSRAGADDAEFQAALLLLPFYLLYFAFWIANLIRYRDRQRAYREIPFERSAYRLESRTGLRPLTQAFDWLRK